MTNDALPAEIVHDDPDTEPEAGPLFDAEELIRQRLTMGSAEDLRTGPLRRGERVYLLTVATVTGHGERTDAEGVYHPAWLDCTVREITEGQAATALQGRLD